MFDLVRYDTRGNCQGSNNSVLIDDPAIYIRQKSPPPIRNVPQFRSQMLNFVGYATTCISCHICFSDVFSHEYVGWK